MSRRKLGALLVVSSLVGCLEQAPAVEPAGSAGAAADESGEIGVVQQALTRFADADVTIRAGLPNSNDGSGSFIGVTSASIADIKRSIIRFKQSDITSAIPMGQVLHSARLELTIAGVSAGWLGGGIDIFPMKKSWAEGAGSIIGATWNCAADTNTTNFTSNCGLSDLWSQLPTGPNGLPYFTPASDRVPIFTGGVGTISFDVTADVQKFIAGTMVNNGWMLAGTTNPLGGEWVNFGSKSSSIPPRLILDFGADDCVRDPLKGKPGSCGCGIPDEDVNFDDVPDCFDGIVTATGDTTLRLSVPYGNDGTGTLLEVSSASIVDLERTLVKFSPAAIDAVRAGRLVTRAYLELSLSGVAAGFAGGTVQVNRMTHDWAEGNGLLGHGASWFCSDDVDTTIFGLLWNDCAWSPVQNNWGMQLFDPFPRPFLATASASTPITFPGPISVRFDVTNDVRYFVDNPSQNFGWILQGAAANPFSGAFVNFGSRETGAPPRLLMDLAPACPIGTGPTPDTAKPAPGVCGCFLPETDTDFDGTKDCQDQCPTDNLKQTPGVCGCGVPDVDTDGDCIPNCLDMCPASNDASAGGQCGCPGPTAKPAGTPCGDGLGTPFETCDGAGHCGNFNAKVPEPSCSCKLVRTHERSYWFCPCARTRTVADQRCTTTQPGQTLVDINSREENDLVTRCLNATSWTGANDLGATNEGRWTWSGSDTDSNFWNGTAAGSAPNGRWSNWKSGEPTSTPDCATISNAAADKGKWASLACTSTAGFVCETDRADVQPPSPTNNGCDALRQICDPGTPPVTCVASPPPLTTEPQIQARVDEIERCARCPAPNGAASCMGDPACLADCSFCAGALAPATGPACSTPLAPPITFDDSKLCPLQLSRADVTNTMIRCSGPDDFGCPVGQECGYASKCTSCDETTSTCTVCLGEQDCPGLDDRCETFLACGQDACQYSCTNDEKTTGATPMDNPAECRLDSDCTVAGERCGWSARCSKCDPSSQRCFPCDSDSDCPQPDDRCVAYLACGTSHEGCILDEPPSTGPCDEVAFCPHPSENAGPFTNTALDATPNSVPPLSQSNFPAVPEPGPQQFPPMPPCGPDTPVECPEAGHQLGSTHPYCNYTVPNPLNVPQSTTAVQNLQNMPAVAGKGFADPTNDPVKVSIDPDLSLNYEIKPGPLGLVYPKVSAGASFFAGVEVAGILGISDSFPVIDLKAQMLAGIDPAGLCGVLPGDSKAIVFGMDLLPAGFEEDLTIPDSMTQSKCATALESFQTSVDRVKKAFFDAQVLLKEYYDRVKTNATFPAAAGAVKNLCQQLKLDMLPTTYPQFPPLDPAFTCATEPPEATINRFIAYYNLQLQQLQTQAVDTVVKELNELFTGVTGRVPDGLGFTQQIAKLHDLEEITILNQTFMIGPIPCNLQVMFTIEYGLNITATAELRPGVMLKRALSRPLANDREPVAWAGIEGTPYAQAGVGLFVGVGFDIGVAAATAGILGTLTLARIDVPAYAGAGLVMDVQEDESISEPLPSYLNELKEVAHMTAEPAIPVRKFSFDLSFRYGLSLDLNNVLQGGIDVRLRIKFLFFSRTWRKNIIRFNGFNPAPIVIFQGDQDIGTADWGTIKLPMPFFGLRGFEPAEFRPVKPAQPAYDQGEHEDFVYDQQCKKPPI